MSLNIVLYTPEIPQNTGNIGRTAYLSGCRLHLIEPLGFKLNEKSVRRAGLDYWKQVDIEIHRSFEAFLEKYGDSRIFLSTTTARKSHSHMEFKPGDFIVFGCESAGLPKEIRAAYTETSFRIPMISTTDRSLNLSNSVAIVIYEALRQIDYPGLI